MNFIKKPIVLITTTAVIAGSLYFAATQGYLDDSPLEPIKNISFEGELPDSINISEIKLPSRDEVTDFTQDATKQTKVLSSRASEVSEHTENILGATIEEGDEDLPIHEKALEYGRYIYCQEVVKDYQSRFDTD